MKNWTKRTIGCLSLLVIPFIIYYTLIYYYNYIDGKENFSIQVGRYQFDHYINDHGEAIADTTAAYKNLILELKINGSFNLNMRVPSIGDTVGRWVSRGSVEQYGFLLIYNKKYNAKVIKRENQFRPCCGPDSMIVIDSDTNNIRRLYFKKIK